MENKLILKPEELYYLGGKLNAKYIDYAYVAAMKDIQSNYAMYESNVKNSLEKQGIIEEDFRGNLEISKVVNKLLAPIFFGSFESSIDECEIGDEEKVNSIKFHFLDGEYVGVVIKNRLLEICKYSKDEIITYFSKLLENVSEEENLEKQIFDRDKIKKIIVLKSVVVGKVSNVKILFQDEKYIYEENVDEEIVAKTNQELLNTAEEILLEDRYGI